MLIPERSSHVRKWIVPVRAVRWALGLAASLVVVGIFTTFMTLRYVAKQGEFQEAVLKSQYLEGEIQRLQNKISTADATIVRVQNFERKLRVLARIDAKPTHLEGIGPITPEDEQALGGGETQLDGTLVASAEGVPASTKFRMRSLELSVDDLHSRATLQEQSLQELYELLKDQDSLLSSTPSIWPAQGWLTSQFGYRVSPFTGIRQLHAGLDIAAPVGTKVTAAADGIVTQAITDPHYGKVVIINHGYGVVTRYGHNSEVMVKPGQRVRRGDVISMIGSTGRATGPHLHYEIHVNGIPVNPSRYILN